MNDIIGARLKEGIALRFLKSERGFTLLEVLAAFVLLAMMATLVIGIFLNGYSSITKMGVRSENMHATRTTVERAASGTTETLLVPNRNGAGSLSISGEKVEAHINATMSSKITLFIPTPPLWISGTSYTLDDKVRYNQVNYICKIPHTANAGNAPGIGKEWSVLSP